MCETKELVMAKLLPFKFMAKLLPFKFTGDDLMGVSAEPKMRKMARTLRWRPASTLCSC